MTPLRRLWFFLTRWRRARDLDEEMRLHVELRATANRRRGLPADEAAYEARRRFGNQLKLREESRDTWGFGGLEHLAGDLRYTVRQLVRRPVWTLTIVTTLALGIGASTSIFTLIDTMLFKPAPWSRSARLVWIVSVNERSGQMGDVSYADYRSYRDHAGALSGVLAYAGNGVGVGGARAERANAGLVSANYFDVLGIHAAIGRTFAANEGAEPDAPAVVVLSDAFWKAHFAADPDVLNHTVSINGKPFTIVGVAPRGFSGMAFADNAEDLWMPLAMQPVAMPQATNLLTTGSDARWLRVVGRLNDGETTARADAEVRLLAKQLTPRGTPPEAGRSARARTVQGGMIPEEQDALGPTFGLIAIVPAFVLLVACANVANILVARHVSRRKELALRKAIGASRGRLVRLLLMEAAVLALLAAVAGFAVSFALTIIVAHYAEVPADFSALVMPDGRALVAATMVAVASTLFFGLAPALTGTRFDALPALKEEGITSTEASGRVRVRQVLVVTQVALSLALLIASGLFLQSLVRTMHVDPGFEPHGLVTVSINTDLLGFSASRRGGFMTALLDRVAGTPGVTAVAATDVLPINGVMYGATVTADEAGPSVKGAWMAAVSPGYFRTLGLPLRQGREFTAADATGGVPVAIVNDTLAQRLWPAASPLGKRVRTDSKAPWRTVVGVARDAKYLFLTEPPRAACYLPFSPDAASASLVVRAAGDPRPILLSLTSIAHDLEPDLPVFQARSVNEQIRRTLTVQRAIVLLLSVLGGLTLVLAAVGLYGVAANSVSRRTREVGVRISLGARPMDVLVMVLRENLSLSLIGVAVGLAVATAGSRIVSSFLFGVTSTDALTLVAGSVVLCLITVVATYIPARRAARLDPLVALRHD